LNACVECTVKDIPVNYEVSGHGRPVVVLHGASLDHRCVKAGLEPAFSKRDGWRRIYLDLPGHGKTPGSDWIKSNDQMVDVLVSFVEAVIPGQRFAIIGQSYGAYLARGLAHRMADSVDGLFLWVPASYPKSERKLPTHVVRVKDELAAAGLRTKDEAEFFGELVVQSQKAVEFMRAYMSPAWDAYDQEFFLRVRDTKLSLDFAAPRFEKPTLIICGRQDAVAGYENAYDLLEKYPIGTIVVADGAGHLLGLTEGEPIFKASLGAWLDTL
jgi:pimeloyl-ACP methyl ester carboxylesterase